MLDVQILYVDVMLVGKSVKDALEKRQFIVSMHPMFVYSWFYLFELEPRVGVEGEVEVVFPVHPEIADEEALRRARQIEHTNNIVDLGRTDWTDRACEVKFSAGMRRSGHGGLTTRCAYELGRIELGQDVGSLAQLINKRRNHTPDVDFPMVRKRLYQTNVWDDSHRPQDAVHGEDRRDENIHDDTSAL